MLNQQFSAPDDLALVQYKDLRDLLSTAPTQCADVPGDRTIMNTT